MTNGEKRLQDQRPIRFFLQKIKRSLRSAQIMMSKSTNGYLHRKLTSCTWKTIPWKRRFLLKALQTIWWELVAAGLGARNWVVIPYMFYVHAYFGKWSNFTNIFQFGWNHKVQGREICWILTLNPWNRRMTHPMFIDFRGGVFAPFAVPRFWVSHQTHSTASLGGAHGTW